MKAKELIGKKAIRTSPYKNSNDFSFTERPIFVVCATDEYIVYKMVSSGISSKSAFNYCPECGRWLKENS